MFESIIIKKVRGSKYKHHAVTVMKRLISMVLTLAMTMSLGMICAAPAVAADTVQPSVRVNGYLVDFPDQKPFINEDGRTMIPVRFVAEALEADVTWNGDIGGAVIVKDGITLQLPIGSKTMTVIRDGVTSTVEMDTTAVLLNGRTLVPIRPVAEALGAWVGYSPYYSTVQIYDDVLTPEEINELHSLSFSWDICEERAPLVAGNTDYENLHELCIREFSSDLDYVIRNNYTNETYTNKVDSLEDKVDLLSDYIPMYMERMFTRENMGVTATFRTDSSCTFANPVTADSRYVNYGYLTLAFDTDADIARYAKLHDGYRIDLGNVQAGKTYTYTLETGWFMNIAQQLPNTTAYFTRSRENG